MAKRNNRFKFKPFKKGGNFKKSSGQRGPGLTQKEFKGSLPQPEKQTVDSSTYEIKAFRDLQNVGSIEVKADPNSEILKGGYPYSIIAQTNKVVDAKYAGRPNIDGNILTRLQNSNKSQLLNVFDVVTINVRTNYLYACYKTSETTHHNNLAVNYELVKSINEALSKGYSTMLTQLPYYTDTIATDMPEVSGVDAGVYGKLGGLLHYQTVLQNAVSPLSKYIQTISLQQTVLNMSYRREAPTVTALYGLLMKKAFKATMNSIGTNIIGEYFDVSWYKQLNTLANVCSRKSDSMADPLMTATMTTLIPKCTFTTPGSETPYYDSDKVLESRAGVWFNPDTWENEGTSQEPVKLSFETLVYRLNRMLDVSTILTWARKLNTDPNSIGIITTPSAYYQIIIKYIEALNIILASFNTYMTELRTFIDKLESSGMVYWKKGISISIEGIKDYTPTYNVILHNMIACYIGNSSEMKYDQSTQRWQAVTLWNKYTGIPKFDSISGGAFLTFGLRNINQGDLDNTDIAMCLPVMFASELDTNTTKCLATTRKGVQLQITPDIQESLISDPVLSRLDPLDVAFKVKVPTMTTVGLGTELSTTEHAKLASAASKLLLTICGYGRVTYGQSALESNTTSACDPDYVCFLDLQIEDVSNEMIQFCRNYTPFRIMTSNGKRTMGFGE